CNHQHPGSRIVAVPFICSRPQPVQPAVSPDQQCSGKFSGDRFTARDFRNAALPSQKATIPTVGKGAWFFSSPHGIQPYFSGCDCPLPPDFNTALLDVYCSGRAGQDKPYTRYFLGCLRSVRFSYINGFPFSGLILIPSISNRMFHPDYELDKEIPTGYFINYANSEPIE
ncbi:MAG: hypothetical protein AB1Z38_07925, partial [Desulfotignum sp.]